MKTFIIEKEDDYKFDFCWHLNQAINFNNWYNGTKIYSFLNVSFTHKEKEFENLKEYKGLIPVGSVEFVHKFMEVNNKTIPKPLNIPDELKQYEYLKRGIGVKFFKDLDIKIPIFIKPNIELKKFTGFVAENKEKALLFEPSIKDNTEIFYSDVIDIISEYRCFIYNKELVGVKHYDGDFKLLPNFNIIKRCINDYKKSPISYTLDFGITDKNETVLIEAQNFYSVGLYGFNDYKILPEMYIKWFEKYE